MTTICEPNIMILDQTVLEIFCSQGSKAYSGKVEKTSEKGHNSATTSPTEKKKICIRLLFILFAHIKISRSYL